jgi:Ca2+-binding EF-hand superfamily protein
MITSLCVVCTLQEFGVAMERCGMGLSAAQTMDLFHALDTNNTDSISFQVRAAQRPLNEGEEV